MPSRSRLALIRLITCLALLVLIPGPASLQVLPIDYAAKYPGIEGLYEITIPGQPADTMQVYFKDGSLGTVSAVDASSTRFDPVEGQELRFTRTSPAKGTFDLEFLKDDEGRFTRFRVTNATQKLEAIATKKADFDDAKADPASPSDRQGYFERHYRKTEVMIPMRDGVRLFTQIYSPIDRSEPHPVIFYRTPYGAAPYGPEFSNYTMPSLLFMKENYILVGQEVRGTFAFSGTRAYFQEKIELPFFNYYLKGRGTLDIPEAVVFETGTDLWRTYDAWPPAEAEAKKVFFAGSGRLSFDAPAGPAGPGFDEFPSDPAKPVPSARRWRQEG